MDILNSTVQVLDENGKLVTESLTDYTRKNILGTYATLTDFITAWHSADKKKVILEELYKKVYIWMQFVKQKIFRSKKSMILIYF